jgi:hypothetical protein
MRRLKFRSWVTAIVAGAVVGSGCGGSPSADSSAESATAVGLDAVVATLYGFNGDYVASASPADLARHSELVIDGTLMSLSPGPGLGPEGESTRTVVLAVRVDRILAGLPEEAGKTLYVESFCGGCTPTSVPVAGVRVVAYLNRRLNSAAQGLQPTNPGAGAPKGAPLWNASHPFGLILQDAAGTSVQPLVSADSIKVGTESFMPSSDRWPSASGTKESPEPDTTPQYPLGSSPAST